MSVDRQLKATGLACVLLLVLVILFGRIITDPMMAATIAVAGNVIVACFAGGIILSTAAGIPKGEALRTRWAVIGLGIVTYVIGELIVGYYLVALQTLPPYPGLADAFFVASRLAFAIGIMDAALSVRRFGSAIAPLVMSLLVCLALLALSAGFLAEILVDPTLPPLEKALDLYRPLAGIFLGVLPALLVVFSMALKGGRFGWPWIPVSAGMIALSLGDVVYSWASWNATYQPGGLIDALWIVGYSLLALGALAQTAVEDSFAEQPTPGEVAPEPAA